MSSIVCIVVLDKGNCIEEVRRQKEAAGDDVEGFDEGLGLVDVVQRRLARALGLHLSHRHGRREGVITKL